MRKMDWDPSLAFTALLDLDPGMTSAEMETRKHALLDAWHAQNAETNFWHFAAGWVKANPRGVAR